MYNSNICNFQIWKCDQISGTNTIVLPRTSHGTKTRLLFLDSMLNSFLVGEKIYSSQMHMQGRKASTQIIRRNRKLKSIRLENKQIMNNSKENNELPDSLRKIIVSFQLVWQLAQLCNYCTNVCLLKVPEPAQRYKQLLFLAQKLEPFENVRCFRSIKMMYDWTYSSGIESWCKQGEKACVQDKTF